MHPPAFYEALARALLSEELNLNVGWLTDQAAEMREHGDFLGDFGAVLSQLLVQRWGEPEYTTALTPDDEDFVPLFVERLAPRILQWRRPLRHLLATIAPSNYWAWLFREVLAVLDADAKVIDSPPGGVVR